MVFSLAQRSGEVIAQRGITMRMNLLRRTRSLALSATVLTGLVLAGTANAASADPDVATIGPRPSSNVNGVICIQKALQIDEDGYYGQQVYDAVKQFQADNGLSADGAVGQETGQLLYALETTPAWCYDYMPTTYQ